MTLELEFYSDKDVEYAVRKFLGYDKKRLTKSLFFVELKKEVEDYKVPKILKVLGAEIDYATDDGFEMIALTAYLRSSTNFLMETDKKYINMMTAVLDFDMLKFINALYITNTYRSARQGEIQNFITEIWEECLTAEKRALRPFSYDNIADLDDNGKEDEIPDFFQIPKAQINATAKLDKETEAKAKSANVKKETDNA